MKTIIFICLIALCLSAYATKPPRWDEVYTVKGMITIPYAEIEEPFEAWYDKHTQRSRIDYYGGMVKTYQLTHDGDFGTSLKIAPVSTDEKPNVITCLQVNGTSENKVEIQSVLLDCKDFSLEESLDFMGFKCDKFVYEEVIGHKKNKYTMYVRYVKSPKYPSSRQPIPVRYEMRGYNTSLGSHYDHYYLNYDSYAHDDIPDDIFEVDQEKPCVGFPGPGNGHYATFNPMKEFVHPADVSHVDFEHMRFINKHGVVYSTTEERLKRHTVFMQNLRYIHSKNREKLGFTLTVNRFADRTDQEMKALRGFKRSKQYNGGNPFPYRLTTAVVADLPDDYDWRLYGAVTPVKDQSICGSCWSFGTAGAIEGEWFVANSGDLVRVSQQALVDCSWGYGNNGCDGGEDFRAYQWIKNVGGIPTEESYGGYLGQDGLCHVTDQNVTLVAPITGWVNVTVGSPNAIKVALLKHGPICVAIDASHKSFSFYSNGVYFEPKCTNTDDSLDHAVLVVGYGLMNGEQYWLVKNSWSNMWGNDGYVLMSARDNNCGVLLAPTYVTFN